VNQQDFAARTVSPDRIEVVGDLDMVSCPQLVAALAGVASGADVTLDLSGVTFMDSTALALLVKTHETRRAGGARLVLAAPSAVVTRLLHIAGLLSLFTYEQDGS
jgi:anti-anti-sigma factor